MIHIRAYALLNTTITHQQDKDVKKFLTKHKTSFAIIKKQIEENILNDAKKNNTEAAFARQSKPATNVFIFKKPNSYKRISHIITQ